MTRISKVLTAGFVGLLFAACLGTASDGVAQAYVGTNIDERVTVAVRAAPAAVQAWLPEGWEPNPSDDGVFSGANLMLVFVDRLINLDADGSPAGGGAFSVVGLIAPARNVATGETAPFVIRIYGPHEGAGPYKNSVQAEVSRQAQIQHENIGTGTGRETWHVSNAAGGEIALDVAFERDIPMAQSQEQKPRSAVDPDFYRIYRVNQLVDVVLSAPEGIRRVSGQQLDVSIPELGELFDGNEWIVGIAIIPAYARQTSCRSRLWSGGKGLYHGREHARAASHHA